MLSLDGAPLLNCPEWPLLIALAIGLLIGMERERHNGEETSRSAAGLRTFAIVGLLGGAAAATGHESLILLAGGFVAVGALIAYALGDRQSLGLTGEVALALTFVLGVLAQSKPVLALEVGVVVAALLAFRIQLHHFVRERISDRELLDAMIFAVAAIVVLPLLPDHPIDPYGLLNPFTLWRLAVIAMALSSAGYAAQHVVDARYGFLFAGLAAGLVSSTAAVVTMGARSRSAPTLTSASAAGATASLIGSLSYLSVVIGAVSPRLLAALAPSLGLAAAVLLAYAAWLVHGSPKETGPDAPKGRAFNGLGVIVFVGLVGGFSIASELLIRWLGASAALGGAVIMGLADAHAASVSMATLLASEKLAASAALLGVLLALSTNMGIKIPAAFMIGNRAYAARVTAAVCLLIAALWVGYGAMALATVAQTTRSLTKTSSLSPFNAPGVPWALSTAQVRGFADREFLNPATRLMP